MLKFRREWLLVGLAVVLAAAPAEAQLSPVTGASTQVLGSEPAAWIGQNYDVAFDSTNDVYLLVYNTYFSELKGQWIGTNGLPVGSAFSFGPGEVPRLVYEASSNVFLLTYTHASARKAVVLRYQAGPAVTMLTPSALQLGGLSWIIDTYGGAVYVPSTGAFLATWWDAPGIPGQSYVRWVKPDGTMGTTTALTPAGESHEVPDIACSPTECLAVGKYYNDAAARRGLWGRWLDLNGTPTGNVFYLDVSAQTHDDPLVAYSPTQSSYLITWTKDFGYPQGMRLTPGSTTGSAVFATSNSLGGQTRIAYNTGSQTFVQSMGGWNEDVFAQQLDAQGSPSGSPVTVSNGPTRDSRTALAANSELKHFLAVYRHDVTNVRGLLLQSASGGTTPTPTPTGTFGPAAGAITRTLVSEPSAWIGQNYDIAFDTTNNAYLVVYNTYFLGVVAHWMDTNGNPVGSPVAIGPGEHPRITYEAGNNLFLLTYTHANQRKAIFLRHQPGPGLTVLNATPHVLGTQAWTVDSFGGAAYVPGIGAFLVTWWDAPGFPGQSYVRSLKPDGTLGATTTLTPVGESHEVPDIACGVNECLAVGKYYNDAAARRGLWAVWLNTTGVPTSAVFYLDVSSQTHDDPLVAYSPTQTTYLVTWTKDFGYPQAMRLAPGSTSGSAVFATTVNKLGGQTRMAYNAGTVTFVQSMGGWNEDMFAQQLDALGNPSGSPVTVSNGPTRDSRTAVAANPGVGQFLAIYRHDVTNIRGLLLQGTLADAGPYLLTTVKAGTGTGAVTSNPAGIACGTDCSEAYPTSTVVALTAAADAGSIFAGWSGDADCSDGSVTMSAARSCVAIFNLATAPISTFVSTTPQALRFAATKAGSTGALTAVTAPQAVTVQVDGPTVGWTAVADQPWVQITNGTGSGSGQFFVSIADPGNVLAGATSAAAVIAITPSTAGVNAPLVAVTLAIDQSGGGTTTVPFGFLDSPADGSTDIMGSIPVTGWALDDVGIADVKLYRTCLSFDVSCQSIAGRSLVFMGHATIVTGSRPDVEAVYPAYPDAKRAGWGYMLLTNMLPHVDDGQLFGGQGTLTIYAVATDVEGRTSLIGQSQITLANNNISKPFGAIDTPGQGAITNGRPINFGWVVAPDLNSTAGDATDILMPIDGSTIRVYIDGADRGRLTEYNLCRGSVGNPVPALTFCDDDVSNVFGNPAPLPAGTARTANPTRFRNLDAGRGPIGYFTLDTTTMVNGRHEIVWIAVDSQGRGDGIGSRYFYVLNSGSADTATAAARLSADAPVDGTASGLGASSSLVESLPFWNGTVHGRDGFAPDAPSMIVPQDADGVRRVRVPQLGRVELLFGPVDSGYLVANGTLRDLPAGSSLDVTTGRFAWIPGPSYLGSYRLVFVRDNEQIPVEVTVGPVPTTAPGDSEIRMHLDTPWAGQTVSSPFVLAGWALDPAAWTGSGIGTIHVWAQRVDAPGVEPAFLGVAALTGERPDVGATFGRQFDRSGFSLTVEELPPGVYDVTAYAWNFRTGRWEDARTARVTVR